MTLAALFFIFITYRIYTNSSIAWNQFKVCYSITSMFHTYQVDEVLGDVSEELVNLWWLAEVTSELLLALDSVSKVSRLFSSFGEFNISFTVLKYLTYECWARGRWGRGWGKKGGGEDIGSGVWPVLTNIFNFFAPGGGEILIVAFSNKYWTLKSSAQDITCDTYITNQRRAASMAHFKTDM